MIELRLPWPYSSKIYGSKFQNSSSNSVVFSKCSACHKVSGEKSSQHNGVGIGRSARNHFSASIIVIRLLSSLAKIATNQLATRFHAIRVADRSSTRRGETAAHRGEKAELN